MPLRNSILLLSAKDLNPNSSTAFSTNVYLPNVPIEHHEKNKVKQNDILHDANYFAIVLS